MSFPSQEEELELHERLLDGDKVASHDVFVAFMPPMLAALGANGRGLTSLQQDEVTNAATDAVMAYVTAPGGFKPEQGRLRDYLLGTAKHKLRDLHRSREARLRREERYMEILQVHAPSPERNMETRLLVRQLIGILQERLREEEDWTLIRLMIEGVKSTRDVSEALGLPQMPEAELRREVKRYWDRFHKRLSRTGEELADVDA